MGFFTRQSAKSSAPRPSHRPVGKVVIEGAVADEVRKRVNPDAAHPEMPPSGSERPWLYILGEAPGREEDEQGEPFVGMSGQLLREQLPRSLDARTRINNVVTTRPRGNRAPLDIEIEAFRETLVADIERTRPRVILGLGITPLAWAAAKTGINMTITAARGRKILLRVGSHTCWFMPTLHPSFVSRLDNERSYFQEVPGEEWVRAWQRDIEAAVHASRSKRPPPKVLEPTKLTNALRLLDNPLQGIPLLRAWKKAGLLTGWDIETKHLRPQATGAKILSMAFSSSKGTFAVPIAHPQATHSPKDNEAFYAFLRDEWFPGAHVVTQNGTFEMEWVGQTSVGWQALRLARWEDTMHLGYTLDSRKGALSLNFLTWAHLGLALKRVADVDTSALDSLPLRKVLHYNALDAKGTRLLFARMRPLLVPSLRRTYRAQVAGALSAATMQASGVPVSKEVAESLGARMRRRTSRALHTILAAKPVKVYQRRVGKTLNPGSNADLTVLFRDILQRREGVRKPRGGGAATYTTDEEMLSQVISNGGDGADVAKALLVLRQHEKLLSTYITPVLTGARGLVWPDGKIHCDIRTTATDTGRTATEKPNMQNWPKRKNREVRGIITAPPGFVVLSSDLGQIEARCLCMASGDPFFTQSLWDGYDIHLSWAERIAKRCPKAYAAAGRNIKEFRSRIKNEMVFPAFYGAQPSSIAGYINIEVGQANRIFAEFWEEFAGVRKWQEQSLRDYRARGFVETLTGRRRLGPLSKNMTLNTPIQGLAADILRESWRRIVRAAILSDRPWLLPCLNIHDDLTFILPKRKVDDALEVIVPAMVKHPQWDWVNVPLTTEVSVGSSWADLEEIGAYDSRKV